MKLSVTKMKSNVKINIIRLRKCIHIIVYTCMLYDLCLNVYLLRTVGLILW